MYANSFLQIKNLIEQSKSFANVNDMLKVKNLGRKSLDEVISKLVDLGLNLKVRED